MSKENLRDKLFKWLDKIRSGHDTTLGGHDTNYTNDYIQQVKEHVFMQILPVAASYNQHWTEL